MSQEPPAGGAEPPSTRRREGLRPPAVPGFELRALLGRGGMGAVWRALELASGREVALKLLTVSSDDPARKARFRREAELTARLLHPGIVRVLSLGEAGGRPWIAYELIEGARSLRAALAELPHRRRVELVRDAARALAHAHARGVVHRDVKAENLLLDGEGRLRVADFGLAQAADLERLTRTGARVGTPGHMAPEQLRGEPSGPPADVWALGVLLYEALTEHSPFAGASMGETMARVEAGAPPPPRRLDRTIPAALEAVCLRALTRDPAARYPEAGPLADALEAWLSGVGGAEAGTWAGRIQGARARLLLLLGLALLIPLPLLLLPPRVDAAGIAREVRELGASAEALLEGDGLLASDAARVGALRQRWRELEAEAERGQLPPDPAARAVGERLLALEGLLAAGQGDMAAASSALASLQGAPQHDSSGAVALEGTLLVAAHPERAAELLDAARRRGVGLLEVRLAEALALLRTGELPPRRAEEALNELERALARRGGRTPEEEELRVGALLALDRIEAAEAALQELAAPAPQLHRLCALARARAAILADQAEQALELLRRAPPGSPATRVAERRLADEALGRAERLLEGARQLPGAGDQFLRLLQLLCVSHLLWPEQSLAERWAAPLLERGVAYVEGQRLTGEQLLDLADLFPDDAHVQEVVALHAGRMGAREKAPLLPVLRRALTLAGEQERREALGVNLVRNLLHLEQVEECLETAQRLAAEPWSPQARSTLLGIRAEAWGRRGAWDLAIDDLERARAIQPDFLQREPLTWARVLRGAGQTEAAFGHALVALEGEVVPEDMGSAARDAALLLVWELGQALRDERRLAGALEAFLARNRSWSGWWVRLAWVRLTAGEAAPAADALRQAADGVMRRRDQRMQGAAERWRELADRIEAGSRDVLDELHAQVEALERRRGPNAYP